MDRPKFNSSSSAGSISSLKSLMMSPTGTVLRRSSGSSTSILPAITPDPAALSSWTSVFENYPPPQVRVIAFQVGNEAQAKREQLRSLVGESYRDLLSTADTIIDMNGTAQVMEERFRTLATSCGSKIVRSRAETRDALAKAFRDRDATTKTSVAIVKIMNDLCHTIEILLRTPSLILTAAKLLLVVKELAASTGSLESSRMNGIDSRLSRLEARYFRCVDSILSSTVSSYIIDALVSYSLYTSSSPSGTLSYFLAARSKQLENLLAQTTSDSLLSALAVMDFTITSTKTLFANQFNRALTRATILPALSDAEFRKLPHIDFWFLKKWCPKHILEFVPMAVQDAAGSPIDVMTSLTSFQVSSMSSFETGIRRVITMISRDSTVTSQNRIESLLTLRRTIFESLIERPVVRSLLLSKDITWESLWFPTLKSLCNMHLNATVAIADQLSEIVSNADGPVAVKSESNPVSLWDDAWMTFDISRGGLDFRSAVTALIEGNAGDCGDILVSLKSWWNGINEVRKLVGRVRGVYGYESSVGEEEQWIRDVREAAEREGHMLGEFVEDEVIPGGISLLVDKIRILLRESSSDKSKIRRLVRVARRLGELPLAQEAVKDLIGGIVEDSYTTFAEAVFPVSVSLGEIEAYFSGYIATDLWEEESNGAKYPFDTSPWLAESIYDTYVRPIVGSATEDIVLGFPFGVSVCRRVVGQKWSTGMSDGIAKYLEQFKPESDHHGSSKTTPRIEEPTANNDLEVDNDEKNDEPSEPNNTEDNEDTEEEHIVPLSTGTTEVATDESNGASGTTVEANVADSPESSKTETDSSGAVVLGLADSKSAQVYWIQLLFDVMYLGKVFSIDVSALRDLVLSGIEGDHDKLLDTIAKRVESCWKRTRLLYAIL
ncbi:hypothetical protein V1525DRAFT_353788 [Lipomyces kononenkoae]|uniref:Uncharacterized protein n=1 Tax=Lipomyces kononenkoae TaxID=34357 RepID=A0ACC3T9G7_LIPKO